MANVKMAWFVLAVGALLLRGGIAVCQAAPIQSGTSEDKAILTDDREVVVQKLSAEEQQKPYAKYFYMPMAKPDPALVEQVKRGPIDPAQALKHESINDLLNRGYLSTELGYTVFSDGTGYVSSMVKMPGVTPEMIDWWFTWHELEPLRYKIWDHYVHFDIRVDEHDRERLLSHDIPVKERNWNVTHHVKEDIGGGAAEIEIHFVSPKDCGFDMSRFTEPAVGTAICSSGGASMVHIARRIPGGIELRSRFWFPPEAKMPMVVLRGLNLHNLEEYSNLAAILPSLYKEFGPK